MRRVRFHRCPDLGDLGHHLQRGGRVHAVVLQHGGIQHRGVLWRWPRLLAHAAGADSARGARCSAAAGCLGCGGCPRRGRRGWLCGRAASSLWRLPAHRFRRGLGRGVGYLGQPAGETVEGHHVVAVTGDFHGLSQGSARGAGAGARRVWVGLLHLVHLLAHLGEISRHSSIAAMIYMAQRQVACRGCGSGPGRNSRLGGRPVGRGYPDCFAALSSGVRCHFISCRGVAVSGGHRGRPFYQQRRCDCG
mmetsp:Transcript_21536/g.54247  ORF Transcript_21536/g.54247 Transcript_21536/m.54247 type:complete len:248 (+) Transcript_21536:1106-1849(+)